MIRWTSEIRVVKEGKEMKQRCTTKKMETYKIEKHEKEEIEKRNLIRQNKP